jgi:hypothetical protein
LEDLKEERDIMVVFKKILLRQARWYLPIIPFNWKLKLEDHEFGASLDNIVRTCLQKYKKTF